jgi:serine/threonine protein kinase
MLRSITHPHIVALFGVCVHERRVYLITELCSCNLQDYVLQPVRARGKDSNDAPL